MTEPSVCVVGLGYVGLPLAMAAVKAGIRTVGLDISTATGEALRAGRSHVDDVTDAEVAEAVAAGFVVTDDSDVFASVDNIVVCVPTPLDEHQAPDLGAVFAAMREVATRLRRDQLVVLESTTYPGTTDGPVREILETSGLVAGEDFHLAFSPERIDPGNLIYGFSNTPKVVGGLTEECADRAVELYSLMVDEVVRTTGPREAEMAKLLENTYRHVNIALVNEMAVFSHELGVDLWQAIDAAATKPFGFQAFYPGPGVGGHCIPIDPNYLSYSVRALGYQFRFVELAQDVSGRMPAYVVSRVQNALNDREKSVRGSRVLVLGLTYKAGIADDRETPARPVIRGLLALGATVIGHDPMIERFEVDGTEIDLSTDLDVSVQSADLVLILQHHASYDLVSLAARAELLFDTRGRAQGANVVRL